MKYKDSRIVYISAVRISPTTMSCPSYSTLNKSCLTLIRFLLHTPTPALSDPRPELPGSVFPCFRGPEDPRYVRNTWTAIEGRHSVRAEANVHYRPDPTQPEFLVEWRSATTIVTVFYPSILSLVVTPVSCILGLPCSVPVPFVVPSDLTHVLCSSPNYKGSSVMYVPAVRISIPLTSCTLYSITLSFTSL